MTNKLLESHKQCNEQKQCRKTTFRTLFRCLRTLFWRAFRVFFRTFRTFRTFKKTTNLISRFLNGIYLIEFLILIFFFKKRVKNIQISSLSYKSIKHVHHTCRTMWIIRCVCWIK